MLSGQMALSRSMDVIANNVANATTTGFKREGINFDTVMKSANGSGGSNKPLHFVTDRATYRDTSNGPITPTNNPLDLAIQGKGYFVVQMPDGSTGYTRAGSLSLDNQGRIVTQAGLPILDDGNAAITLPDTTSEINVASDGFVSARIDNGTDLAQLGKINLVQFNDEQNMQPQGSSIYTSTETPKAADDSAIKQGAIEQSNVNPVEEITSMIQIMRSYEQMTNMISNANDRHSQALDKLSKTTA